MKKHFGTIARAGAFILLWALALMALNALPALSEPSLLGHSPAYSRLWWELLPLLATLAVTCICTKLVPPKVPLPPLGQKYLFSVGTGLLVGAVWLGLPVLALWAGGVLHFTPGAPVAHLWVWLLAVLLNVAMQEYLVRGYLFGLLQKQYSLPVATLVTSVLFTALHPGAFEAGTVAVLNVFTTSVVMSLLLVYSGGLLAPIVAHFVWNGGGAVLLGSVALAEDYPSVLRAVFSGAPLLAGGRMGLEGSAAVLFINACLIILLLLLCRAKNKQKVAHTAG